MARGGHRGGGPVQVTEVVRAGRGEAVRAGRGGDGPWGVTEEAVPYMSRRRSVRSRRRRSVQVAEEVVRAGGGEDLIQKFRILQVFLVFSLMKKLYIDIKQKSPVKF